MHDHILHQQAIEIGNISTFEQSIQEMKKSGTTAPLNACRLTKRNGMVYSMTLLALCGFHGRKEMVDLLLQEGAGMVVNLKLDNKVGVFKSVLVVLGFQFVV